MNHHMSRCQKSFLQKFAVRTYTRLELAGVLFSLCDGNKAKTKCVDLSANLI